MYKHSQNFYDKAYKTYVNKVSAIGGIPLKKNTFRSAYDALKGEGKQPMAELVYSSKYSTKYKTALAEYKMAKSMGTKVKLEDLKQMTTQDFADYYAADLRKTYDDLKAKGITGKAAAKAVSNMWFGSV